MLHNYGGRRALYGNLTRIANGPVEDIMQSPSMVATGLTPEAIENNPVVYELMFEVRTVHASGAVFFALALLPPSDVGSRFNVHDNVVSLVCA